MVSQKLVESYFNTVDEGSFKVNGSGCRRELAFGK